MLDDTLLYFELLCRAVQHEEHRCQLLAWVEVIARARFFAVVIFFLSVFVCLGRFIRA